MNAHPEATPEAGADSGALVELADVSKYYGNVRALEDVSLEVHPGEITCVLGDNGAGKSTSSRSSRAPPARHRRAADRR